MMRPKPFLTYFIFCAIPLLLLAALNYWNGVRKVDSTLNTVAQDDLNSFTVAVDELLEERERDILGFAVESPVQNVLFKKERNEIDPVSNYEQMMATRLSLKSVAGLSRNFQSLTLFSNDRKPLCFQKSPGEWTFTNLDAANLAPVDQRVWSSQGTLLFKNAGSTPRTINYSAPINDEKTGSNLGAVVGVLDLQTVFATASRGWNSRSGKVVAVNLDSQTVYTSDSSVDPTRQDSSSYEVASALLPQLGVTAIVARQRADSMSSVHVWGIAGLVLALLAALAAAFILEHHVKNRSSGIARVREDLSAIAKGELNRRIILQSSDDARGIADNINVVTELLRAQIAREEESRQFESFVRLSAMLTHDLKNAIEGLSLTVSNMERHYDNPQFRVDALKGLTGATDKLKALVARLARPLTSLSGEHKRPTNVDLVPIMQRVIAMNAEPLRNKHTIVTRLPQNLYALVDAARIEEVIENLVLNALEAMDHGGTLTVEAAYTPGGAPMFSVSDTGRGMSKSFIESRLYRPFSTTKKTGIGLGLYTCREVIQASAGSIEVDSVEGAGTTFRVVLPSIPHDRRN
ncbi:MAG TPA: ATP-binding protein [Pyrinomonadaceae bacterium]|nr:ATP-binding protein [Pyrinomonadaceae bacterium]